MSNDKTEMTTTEAFAAVREVLWWIGDDSALCHKVHAEGEAALDLLERRMAKLESAAREYYEVMGTGDVTRQQAAGDRLRAALFDAKQRREE